MAQVSRVKLQHTPPTVQIYAALFTSLQNAAFLRAQLLAGNTDYSYALVDARSLLSTTHLLAAVFRALNDHEAGRLRSRNVHSEVVFSLSPNNNIADSFKRFGIADDTKDLVVLKICGLDGDRDVERVTLDSVITHLTENVQGISVPFGDAAIAACSNLDHIAKLYKVSLDNDLPQKKRKGQNGLVEKSNGDFHGDPSNNTIQEPRKQLEVAVLTAMALKGS